MLRTRLFMSRLPTSESYASAKVQAMRLICIRERSATHQRDFSRGGSVSPSLWSGRQSQTCGLAMTDGI